MDPNDSLWITEIWTNVRNMPLGPYRTYQRCYRESVLRDRLSLARWILLRHTTKPYEHSLLKNILRLHNIMVFISWRDYLSVLSKHHLISKRWLQLKCWILEIYIDDVNIFGNTPEEFVSRLREFSLLFVFIRWFSNHPNVSLDVPTYNLLVRLSLTRVFVCHKVRFN